MRVFFDTSAFVKRFVEETGSQEVEDICQQAAELGLSIICLPEILSALNRKLRAGNIDKGVYLDIKQDVAEDIKDADIINLSPSVLASTIQLLEENTLRSLDAIHIACALEWQADLFISSDERQIAAATNSGLKVVLIQGYNP